MRKYYRVLWGTIIVAASLAAASCPKMDDQPVSPLSSWGITDPLTYTNGPVLQKAADPTVIRAADGAYYCYPTNGPGYKTWKSTDLLTWEGPFTVLAKIQPGSPGYWAESDFWAPDVYQEDGKYYLFYSARRDPADSRPSLRIGAAVSDSPTGPFADIKPGFFHDFGYGVLDAFVFKDDDGQKYLYYVKAGGDNNVSGETPIYGVKLKADFSGIDGVPVRLVDDEGDTTGEEQWVDGVTEAPWVIKHKGTYYLMFSGNGFGGKTYAVGYATSDSPLGTYTHYERNPILRARNEWPHVSGTGHHGLFPSPDDSEIWVAYHTHMYINAQGKPYNPPDSIDGGADLGAPRQLYIDRMGFREDGSIYINGPSLSPQPRPSGFTGVQNLAAGADVTVSSGNKKPLTDGEIGFLTKFKNYDYIADPGDTSPTITLEWDNPVKIYRVMVYQSAGDDSRLLYAEVSLDGGAARKISFPKLAGAPREQMPGGAAELIFSRGQTVSDKCVITLKARGDGAEGLRLSEIVVLGTEL